MYNMNRLEKELVAAVTTCCVLAKEYKKTKLENLWIDGEYWHFCRMAGSVFKNNEEQAAAEKYADELSEILKDDVWIVPVEDKTNALWWAVYTKHRHPSEDHYDDIFKRF